MLLKQIDLNLLVVLDAIYSEGSITGAAAKLHLSQPAISHSLGRLRELLDDPLFTREGRKIIPTPVARALMEPLRRSLRELETTLNEVRRFDPNTTRRHFRIGLREGLEAEVLMRLIGKIGELAPHIDVSAIRFDRRNLEADLAAGRLDMAIDISIPHGERIRRRKFGPVQMVMVVRRGHPRIKKGAIDLDTYLELDHVVSSSRAEGPWLEDVALARRGQSRRVRLRCQHYFAAFCVISECDMALTIPDGPAQLLNRYFKQTVLPLPFRVHPFDFFLYWHDNVENDPANSWMRSLLIEVLLEHEGIHARG